MFEGFDFSNFWNDAEYGNQYIGDEITDELIADVEKELGYKLPESYIWLMKQHNGGAPAKSLFIHYVKDEEIEIELVGIFGIGRENECTICGDMGTKFMVEEWGYPDIGVVIADTISGGHEMIFLDYTECGPEGEPQVTYMDNELEESFVIANNFEEFIRNLKSE